MLNFTVHRFHTMYPDDDACLNKIWKIRYGALKSCPKCLKKTKFYRVRGKKHWACPFCGHCLSPLADTIFHKSSTPLKKWFFAIYLFANSKNGVSAKELERQLGVTYKTAWRMAKQIRHLFTFADEEHLFKNLISFLKNGNPKCSTG
jgi:transposase